MNNWRRFSHKYIALTLFVALGLFVSVRIHAEEKNDAPVAESQQPALPVASQTAEDVAQDILRIQTELGGSLVDKSPVLGPTPELVPAPVTPTSSRSSRERVKVLRHAAWQLDTAAHKLELQDLYQQADQLRTMAASLRQDARDFKGALAKR